MVEAESLACALQPVLDAAQFSGAVGGDTLLLSRSPGSGICRLARAGDVCVASVSGAALTDLRNAGQFADYLSVLGGVPHRVTTLHATLDVRVDASAVVLSLFERAISGHVTLSRKRLGLGDVLKFISRRADGADTGSVYLGGPRAQLRAVIYDKQLERVSKGCADPGPLTRYEMRIKGKIGPTLRDAWEPERIFYHVASPDILSAPEGVPAWTATDGGYYLPPRKEFLPAELMAMKLQTSPDVQRLLALAEECGPNGLELLLQRIREMVHPRAPHKFRDTVPTPLVDRYRAKLN